MKTCFCHLNVVWRPRRAEERLAISTQPIHCWKVHIGLQFCRWQYGCIFIRLSVIASEIWEMWRNSNKIWPYRSSRSSKVIDLGVNGKPICDLLLVINSNFSRICYHFLRYSRLKIENCWFHPPLPCLTPRLGGPLRISGWNLPCKNWRDGATVRWKLHDPSFNRFLRYWRLKGRKLPILPAVTLKPGSGVTQGHWFWYQWKALHRFGDMAA